MATIIRRESPKPHLSTPEVRRVAYDLQDVARHGDEYVTSIRSEAARIIQQANTEAAEIRVRAEKAGRAAAEQSIEQLLEEKVAKQMRTLRPALEAAVAQIQSSRAAWQEHWQQAATKLALQVAGQIVRREIKQQPEITMEWLREALDLAAGASEITVKLNPSDHQHLAGQAAELARVLSVSAPATVVADGSVSLGGCKVETKFGVIDMQLESQLDQLAEEWN